MMMMIAIWSFSVILIAFASFMVGRRSSKSISKHLPALQKTAMDLVGSSDQVKSMSTDLAAASQEQMDSLTSTVSASHEIRSMVETTNQSAEQLKTEAAHLQEMAKTGANVLSKMLTSSQDLKEGAETFDAEMRESIEQLTKTLNVIREIAEKTKVINEIVFQTKLLSFNASVEAARAGEAGKGFAVVAEEVGKLAQMSGNASSEISKIVENSVKIVQQSIDVTREKITTMAAQTVRKSEDGLNDAQACEKIFSSMAVKIEQTATMAESISAATKEQSLGINQLNQSIEDLQGVADRNRLVASQTTEYGREFEMQTSALTRTVGELASLSGRETRPSIALQKFAWSDRFEMGVREMDEEHKILIEKINALVTAIDQQKSAPSREKLMASFLDLAQYTTQHFRDEENYMERTGYPLLAPHKKIHEKLLQQVGLYGEALKNGSLDEQKLISFLRNWLISHILGVDMQYAQRSQQGRGKAA